MSTSTGPVLMAGLIVAGNAIIIQDQTPKSQRRVAIGTAIAAAGLALAENAFPRTAVAFSWLVLLTVLLVRVDPLTPAPLESFQTWYQGS